MKEDGQRERRLERLPHNKPRGFFSVSSAIVFLTGRQDKEVNISIVDCLQPLLCCLGPGGVLVQLCFQKELRRNRYLCLL